MERLQKVMAQAGVASRRKSEELIRSGKVRVNGMVVTELGVKVDPLQDVIEVEGRPALQEKKRYLLFHKPQGVITSLIDPHGRPVVADYLTSVSERVYPVGRLDSDSEGLLLLTNDGELANRMAHPRYEVDKVYLATVKGKPNPDTIRRLAQGVRLEDGWTAPAKVRKVRSQGPDTVLELAIHEGRNRQVRRMCERVGHPVRKLVRTKISFLTLEGLGKGNLRDLKPMEVKKLKAQLSL